MLKWARHRWHSYEYEIHSFFFHCFLFCLSKYLHVRPMVPRDQRWILTYAHTRCFRWFDFSKMVLRRGKKEEVEMLLRALLLNMHWRAQCVTLYWKEMERNWENKDSAKKTFCIFWPNQINLYWVNQWLASQAAYRHFFSRSNGDHWLSSMNGVAANGALYIQFIRHIVHHPFVFFFHHSVFENIPWNQYTHIQRSQLKNWMNWKRKLYFPLNALCNYRWMRNKWKLNVQNRTIRIYFMANGERYLNSSICVVVLQMELIWGTAIINNNRQRLAVSVCVFYNCNYVMSSALSKATRAAFFRSNSHNNMCFNRLC